MEIHGISSSYDIKEFDSKYETSLWHESQKIRLHISEWKSNLFFECSDMIKEALADATLYQVIWLRITLFHTIL